jgi:glycerophosphoryl diester phosphodiesterase
MLCDYSQCNSLFQELRRGKRTLIAAHRGVSGGNIVCNTISSCEVALKQGTDIIEIDVIRTTDGKFYTFHDGFEQYLLGSPGSIIEMSSAEVENLRYINPNGQAIREKVNKLEDMLEHFKGRCLINIDRSWNYWDSLLPYLAHHNMFDQIILKSKPEKDFLKRLEDSSFPFMYMPIIKERAEEIDEARRCRLNLICVEMVFTDERSVLASPQLISQLHQDGIAVWANAITLDDDTLLSGGHDDNISLLTNGNNGWGWLVERGFDILLTDWPVMLKRYLEIERPR